MPRPFAPALLLLAAVAGCGRGGGDHGVGGVTADEAAQLNNAAEMLDASADGLAASPESANGADADDGANAGAGDNAS